MAEQLEEIIIDVQVNAESTAKELADVTALIAKLKAEQRQLTKEIEAGNDADGKLAKQLNEVGKEVQNLTAQQKSLKGQLDTTYRANNQLGDSFREMDAYARQLENQYKALTKAQRESAEGQRLKEALIAQKQALKEFDAELGNHQRNVGNYPQTWASVIPGMDRVGKVFQTLGADVNTFSEQGTKAFAGLGKSVKAFGKVFLTPPVAIIAVVVGALVLAFNKLKEAFARNDDASTKLQAAFAKLQPIGDAIGIMFNKLADVVAGLVEKMMNAYTWIIKLGNRLGIISDEFAQATEAASNLVKSIDELEQMERDYTVNSARRSLEVAKIRNDAMNTDDLKQRITMLKRAIALEEETMKEAQAIAQKRYQNLVQEAEKTGDTSDEMTNKIAQATAEMYRAQETYYTGTRRLLKELLAVEKEYQQEMLDKEELDNFIQETLDKFTKHRDTIKELTKPEVVDEEEEEEFLQPLTAMQEKYAELMKQGYSFADAQKIVANKVKSSYADAASQMAGSFADSFSAIGDMIAEFGEENEEAAKAAKAFALVGIIASEAQAVANGVKAMTEAIAAATAAAAATGPAAPITTPLFIAEMTGIVGGVIASTIANIQQAKNILGGAKFATGGIVGGNSYSGDRVPAMVNSGEMILNKEQQSRLFNMVNSPTANGHYDMMRNAMAEALQEMPAPVMVYSEFQQFGKQVATYKEITTI